MEKISFLVRKITVAPFMAAAMLITSWFCNPSIFQNPLSFWYSILFLTILPLMAYPLQKFIPGFKDKGREGQRSLAMIFAVMGYVLGCIVNGCFASTRELWIIYLEYLFSGILIFLVNKCFHLKISGHACGIVGPLALLITFHIYAAIVPGIILVILVYYSSLKTKRHTFLQLIGGSIVPIVVILMLELL